MADRNPNVIAVDVDGVVTTGGMPDPGQFAPVQTGTRAFLGALRDRGFRIVVFSARSPVERVRQFFRQEGLDRYVDGYTRTKPREARIFLDDRAIQYRGDHGRALAEIDSFVPHWDAIHQYATSQIQLPGDMAKEVTAIANQVPASALNPEETHGGPSASDGREKDIHCTVYYGLTEDNPKLLTDTIKGFGPIKVTLGPLSLFETGSSDVLKLSVESEDLQRLHRLIAAKVPHIDTFPDYKPHVTCCYCLPGKGSDYLTLTNPLAGKSFTATVVVFGDRKGNRTEIGIAGNQDFIDGRNSALDNAAMVAHDMGRPDIRKAINHLVNPPRGPAYG